MSGSIAALASYSGNGTQGLAVSDKIGENVISTIWNKNDYTKQLITGTCLTEIYPQNPVYGSLNNKTTIYTISEFDVIGEIYLLIHIDKHSYYVSNTSYCTLFNKIELYIGNQVWQTIDPTSVTALRELNDSADNSYSTIAVPEVPGPNDTIITLKLNGIFTNTTVPKNTAFVDQVNNGYIMTAAPHQEFKLKIEWSNGDHVYNEISDVTIYYCKCFAKQTTLSNEERKQVSENNIVKRVNYTQTISKNIALSTTSTSYNFEVNLDSFSTYVSGLIIGFRFNNITGRSWCEYPGNSRNFDGTAELFLNGISFCGELPFSLLSQTYGELLKSNGLSSLNIHDFLLFPMSNYLFGSGVPLNKFDTIRLRIKIPEIMYINGPNTNTGMHYRREIFRNDFLDVVSIGQTSVIYSGGSASISKY
jgi:hypothetical protein